MRNPLKHILRRLALGRHASHEPHGILPIGKVKSAVVFVEPGGGDAGAAVQAAEAFFSARGIPARVFCPSGRELNYAGYMKKKVRQNGPGGGRDEDLFISLALSEQCFASEYEARCSTASFKIGVRGLADGVFDMVVCPPQPSPASPASPARSGPGVPQTELFSAIVEYLLKIK